MRLWTGDIHSHPGGLGRPSQKDGKGTGDLGYVEEVFAQNEAMLWFAVPILTNTGKDREVSLHPWLCRRGQPLDLYWADLKVCGTEFFPPRQFNPDWESASDVDSATVTPTPLVAPSHDQPQPIFDLNLFEQLLGTAVTQRMCSTGSISLMFTKRGVRITLALSPGAPSEKPFVTAKRGAWETQFTQYRWRQKGSQDLTIRLAHLCTEVLQLASQDF
jgi:hypothetical protein